MPKVTSAKYQQMSACYNIYRNQIVVMVDNTDFTSQKVQHSTCQTIKHFCQILSGYYVY